MKNKIKKIFELINSIFHLLFPYIQYLRFKGEKLSEINFHKKNNKCLVLGNGPSLKVDMEKISNFYSDFDICVVNHFADSENFKKYQPNKYILLDNYFWESDAHPDLVDKRKKLFEQLNQVDWSIQLYIPSYANVKFISESIKNCNVKIVFYKIGPINNVNISLASKLLKTKVFGPPSCNVLIYAIFICIIAEYEQVNIYGADLSFHNDVTVDQTTNDVIIKYTHFYGSTKYEKLKKNPHRSELVSMFELMQLTTSTFYAHELLSEFAKINNVKIYNKSDFSLIDAYPRA